MLHSLNQKINSFIISSFWTFRKLVIAKKHAAAKLADASQSPATVFSLMGSGVIVVGAFTIIIAPTIGIIFIIAGFLQLILGRILKLKIG